jgi:hypothetical protein
MSLVKAIDENSAGWGSVAACLMLYLAAWSIGEQLTRALDRLDEIERTRRGQIPTALPSSVKGFVE